MGIAFVRQSLKDVTLVLSYILLRGVFARNVLREQPRSSSVSAYSLVVIRIIINSTMNESIS